MTNLTLFIFVLVNEDGVQDLASSCTCLFIRLTLRPKRVYAINETVG
jgi:hypothetical protein